MMKNTVKEDDTTKKQDPTGTDPAALEPAKAKRKAVNSPVIIKEPLDIQAELSKIRLTAYEEEQLLKDYYAAHPGATDPEPLPKEPK